MNTDAFQNTAQKREGATKKRMDTNPQNNIKGTCKRNRFRTTKNKSNKSCEKCDPMLMTLELSLVFKIHVQNSGRRESVATKSGREEYTYCKP